MPVLAVYIYIPNAIENWRATLRAPVSVISVVMYYKKAHISWRLPDDTATLPRAPRPRIEQ
jgi:hypothetical protein